MTPRLLAERFFDAGERVAAAVSGGADSVALLELILEARERIGIEVAVAHFNHRLRGETSVRDAAFVQQLAEKRGLEFLGGSAEAQRGLDCEDLVHQDRYDFFRGLVRQGRVHKVATAHTADDQAEAVLARFLRHGGAAGLTGVEPILDGCIVRPILEVRRQTLREWAASRGFAGRESTPDLPAEGHSEVRNRIREQLLPELARNYNQDIVEILCRAAERFRGEERHWQKQTEVLARLLRADGTGWKLPLTEFKQLDEAEQRRLIQAAVFRTQPAAQRVSFDQVETVRRLAFQADGAGRLAQLPGCVVLRRPMDGVENLLFSPDATS